MITPASAAHRLQTFTRPRVRQLDLARAARVSPAYVSAVVARKKKPSPRLLDVCAELGLPVEDLFGDEGEHENGGGGEACGRCGRLAEIFAERAPGVALAETAQVNSAALAYLNRLSDLLFILARSTAAGDETLWAPGATLDE